MNCHHQVIPFLRRVLRDRTWAKVFDLWCWAGRDQTPCARRDRTQFGKILKAGLMGCSCFSYARRGQFAVVKNDKWLERQEGQPPIAASCLWCPLDQELADAKRVTFKVEKDTTLIRQKDKAGGPSFFSKPLIINDKQEGQDRSPTGQQRAVQPTRLLIPLGTLEPPTVAEALITIRSDIPLPPPITGGLYHNRGEILHYLRPVLSLLRVGQSVSLPRSFGDYHRLSRPVYDFAKTERSRGREIGFQLRNLSEGGVRIWRHR